MKKFDFSQSIPEEFYWFNPPQEYYFDRGLAIKTEANTDFWQRTHYGFQRDNGHCLFTDLETDFSFTAHVNFKPEVMYDQCGLMVRIDKDNWIKISTEYENENISKLGSVVTNLGYSDWATTDISSDITSIWYKISKKNNDFLVENSDDGENWSQMRITHLHQAINKLQVGIYACSPEASSFECKIDKVIIGKSNF